MSVFIIAQLRYTEREAYDRYLTQFYEVFARFNGRVLAADDRPEVIEGAWDRDKVVILEFPDAPSARAFYDSPDYQRIAADRRAGADAIVLQVSSLGG